VTRGRKKAMDNGDLAMKRHQLSTSTDAEPCLRWGCSRLGSKNVLSDRVVFVGLMLVVPKKNGVSSRVSGLGAILMLDQSCCGNCFVEREG
jgi:hypothetical protein